MDLPLKELALITGAALLARRRTKMKRIIINEMTLI